MHVRRLPPGQHELDHIDHTDHADHTDHTDQGGLSALKDLDHEVGDV